MSRYNAPAFDPMMQDLLRRIRAAAAVFNPNQLAADISPKQVRQLQKMEREITSRWKRHKAVQPIQAIEFLPQNWSALFGLSLKGRAGSIPQDLLSAEYVGEKQAMAATKMLMMEMTGSAMFRGNVGAEAIRRMSLSQVADRMRMALYPPYVFLKAAQLSPPNVFDIRSSLVEKLMNTDVAPGLKPSDVRLPFPGIYIRLPIDEEVISVKDPQTGWHQVSLMGFAEAEAQPGHRHFVGLVWGEPNESSIGAMDDSVLTWQFPLYERDDVTLKGQLEEYQTSLTGENRPELFRIYGQTFDSEASMKLIYSFAVNFCLYLSSPNPDVEPTTRGQKSWKTVMSEDAAPKRTRIKATSKKKRRSSKGLPKIYKRAWEVGRNVKALERTFTVSDILTRGHFKAQAHGPRWSLRKIIWIEPYISRRKTGRSAGHDYDVEN